MLHAFRKFLGAIFTVASVSQALLVAESAISPTHLAHASVFKKRFVAGVAPYRKLSFESTSTTEALLCEGTHPAHQKATYQFLYNPNSFGLLVLDTNSKTTKLFDDVGTEASTWLSRDIDRFSKIRTLLLTIKNHRANFTHEYEEYYPRIQDTFKFDNNASQKTVRQILESVIKDVPLTSVRAHISWKDQARWTEAEFELVPLQLNAEPQRIPTECIAVDHSKIPQNLLSAMKLRKAQHALLLDLYQLTYNAAFQKDQPACTDRIIEAYYNVPLSNDPEDPWADRTEALENLRWECHDELQEKKEQRLKAFLSGPR